MTKPSASLHETGFFLQLQQRDGHDDAELGERAAALRDLKLLVGSGCLEFQKGKAGIDSLDKHVEQISFGQCVSFGERWQMKVWQPRCQTTEAKSLVCSSHVGALSVH